MGQTAHSQKSLLSLLFSNGGVGALYLNNERGVQFQFKLRAFGSYRRQRNEQGRIQPLNTSISEWLRKRLYRLGWQPQKSQLSVLIKARTAIFYNNEDFATKKAGFYYFHQTYFSECAKAEK